MMLQQEEVQLPVREETRNSWLQAFRRSTRPSFTFNYVVPFYSKPLVSAGDELENIASEFILYKAYTREKQPPILICDTDELVRRGCLAYCLASLSKREIEELGSKLPEKVSDEVTDILEQYGPDAEVKLFFRPTVALRNLDFLDSIDWKKLVSEVLNFKGAKMDRHLRLVRLLTLLRGVSQATNPHLVVCLPSQTGKSDWYDLAGVKSERVKAISLIGYADTDGIHRGSLDGQELAYVIDQFESQGDWQIFRYLLSLLESGRVTVDTAAQPFAIGCPSPLVILSNPDSGDSTKSFKFLVDHMSRQSALGRRFSVILYDKNAYRLDWREADLEEWKSLFEIFRSVEELAKAHLVLLFNHKELWKWLNRKSGEWIRQCRQIISQIESESPELHTFLTEFILNSTTHVRGGAFRGAVANNLDKITRGRIDLETLLVEAEELYSEIQKMNMDSLRNVMQNYKEEAGSAVKVFVETCPSYLRDIIFAVEVFKRYSKERPNEVTFPSLITNPRAGRIFRKSLSSHFGVIRRSTTPS